MKNTFLQQKLYFKLVLVHLLLHKYKFGTLLLIWDFSTWLRRNTTGNSCSFDKTVLVYPILWHPQTGNNSNLLSLIFVQFNLITMCSHGGWKNVRCNDRRCIRTENFPLCEIKNWEKVRYNWGYFVTRLDCTCKLSVVKLRHYVAMMYLWHDPFYLLQSVHSLTCFFFSSNSSSRVSAARIIERCWLGYRDRQMFKLLKHSICAAVSFFRISRCETCTRIMC